MHQFVLVALATWLLQAVIATPKPLDVLVPLPRHVWDTSLKAKRDTANTTANATVSLQSQEQFMWTSSNNTKQSTIVSMVVYTKQDELIIDMDTFAWDLKSVNCNETMTLQFKHDFVFKAAQKSWQWVNFNGIRSFVLVADWRGCGVQRSRDPWVVSNAQFDSATLTIHLDAVKRTWKDVAHTYTMDFGDFAPAPSHNPRFLDVNLNKAFTLDLTSSFPSNIVTWNTSNAQFSANCNNCGTKGSLVFAGHIEASLFGGVEKFEISATPHGIEAALNLTLGFQGEVDYGTVKPFEQEVTLLTLPIPSGWTIPHLLTFGPNVQINAGIKINYIGGTASVTTGITAQISDDSIAKVDLTSKKPLTISGWIPTFETQPLHVEAQIDANIELYTEVAAAVSLIVLDEDGVNVDIALRFPDLTVTAAAGFNSNGFCPNDPKTWGVKLDATLGAELVLEGWDEVNGHKDVFLSVDLFRNPAIYTFPELCFSFSEESAGTCIDQPENEEEAQYIENEETAGLKRKRSGGSLMCRDQYTKRGDLIPRAASKSRTPYQLTCDANKQHLLFVQEYPGPTRVKEGLGAPIMEPQIKCTATACPPTDWDTKESTDTNIVSPRTWASEHVYEGNWVKNFIDYLKTTYFTVTSTEDPQCNGAGTVFGDIKPTISTPDPVGPSNYSEAIFQNLGTLYTYHDRMTLLPNKQNTLKYRFWVTNEEIVGKTFTAASTNNEARVCAIGRIVTTCKYLFNEKVQAALSLTVAEIEKVLAAMDADIAANPSGTLATATPADLKTKTYKAAHAEWFTDFYETGLAHARNKLIEYAAFIANDTNFNDLSKDKRDAMTNMPTDAANYCINNFVHP